MADTLLKEDGDKVLLETGDELLLETSTAAPVAAYVAATQVPLT